MNIENVESSIKAVTIYPGSAKVLRLATVELTAGINNIVINDLPLSLNESSLRVSGESEGSVSLGSVELSREFQFDVVHTNEKKLREQIEEVTEDRQIILDSLSRYESQLIYIKKMVGKNSKNDTDKLNSYSNLPLDQWKQAWDTLNDSTEAAQTDIRIANKALKEKDKVLSKLNNELRQISTNQKEIRIAKLHIESDSVTSLKLSLSYQIEGANWEPVYDADLDTNSGIIQLKALAQISQRTGEDWNDVDITLSTLRPSAGTQLPQLNPWVIDFVPEPTKQMRAIEQSMQPRHSSVEEVCLSSDLNECLDEGDEEFDVLSLLESSDKRARISHSQSQVISTDFSAEFKVPGTANLNSGDDKRRFNLYSKKINSTIKLESSPRFDPRVMLIASADYKDEAPLLAGNLSLYRNGDFVGSSYLEQKLSGEEIKLSFGEDDKVKIKFLPDADKKRNDGLFDKKIVVERHFKISVSSNHDNTFPITISDVIPVSSNENIKIKEIGEEATNKKVEDKEGVISWDKSLIPNEAIEIKYGYSVNYPKGRDVQGL